MAYCVCVSARISGHAQAECVSNAQIGEKRDYTCESSHLPGLRVHQGLHMCVHEGGNERGRLLWEPVGFDPSRPAFFPRSCLAAQSRRQKQQRPELTFVFRLRSAGPWPAGPPASCCRESPNSPGRCAVLPGAGRAGRRALARTHARRPRGPPSPLRRDGHDPEAAADAAVGTCPGSVPGGEGPGPGARVPGRRRPGRGGGGRARGGAAPRAESAVTLARQVGGGGAGPAGGRWAARVGAL